MAEVTFKRRNNQNGFNEKIDQQPLKFSKKKFQKIWPHLSKNLLFDELSKNGFSLRNRIGAGSYSKVYLATINKNISRQDVLSSSFVGKTFACKVIDRRLTSEDFCTKFLPREIAILKTISHPHIVETDSIIELGPYICIFMDFCPYGDLLDYIQSKGSLSEKRSILYFKQICSAISYLHSINISHRDLKCENILLHSQSFIKLSDFGFATKIATDQENNKDEMSETYCGSTAYAAPEVLKGIPYDPKTYDMWSLGCILFIMLSGVMPFDDTNISKTIRKQETHKIDFPNERVLQKSIKHLISHLLHPDVKKRYRIEDVMNYPLDHRIKTARI